MNSVPADDDERGGVERRCVGAAAAAAAAADTGEGDGGRRPGGPHGMMDASSTTIAPGAARLRATADGSPPTRDAAAFVSSGRSGR
jgi:hypothetical protein